MPRPYVRYAVQRLRDPHRQRRLPHALRPHEEVGVGGRAASEHALHGSQGTGVTEEVPTAPYHLSPTACHLSPAAYSSGQTSHRMTSSYVSRFPVILSADHA